MKNEQTFKIKTEGQAFTRNNSNTFFMVKSIVLIAIIDFIMRSIHLSVEFLLSLVVLPRLELGLTAPKTAVLTITPENNESSQRLSSPLYYVVSVATCLLQR